MLLFVQLRKHFILFHYSRSTFAVTQNTERLKLFRILTFFYLLGDPCFLSLFLLSFFLFLYFVFPNLFNGLISLYNNLLCKIVYISLDLFIIVNLTEVCSLSHYIFYIILFVDLDWNILLFLVGL